MEKKINLILTVFLFYFVTTLIAFRLESTADDEEIFIAIFKKSKDQRILRNSQEFSGSGKKAEEWLSTPMEELKDKCKNKNNTLYNSPELVESYEKKLLNMYGKHYNLSQGIDENTKNCSHFSDDLTVELEKLIDVIQVCFDDTELLDQIEKKKTMEIVLKGVCLRMKQFVSPQLNDQECRKIEGELDHRCGSGVWGGWKEYKKQSIYYMLLMFTVPQYDSCDLLDAQRSCDAEAFKNCSKSFQEAKWIINSAPEGTPCYSPTKKLPIMNEEEPHKELGTSDFDYI